MSEDYIPPRGNPMIAFPFPYTIIIEAGWEDCPHDSHPYRAVVSFDIAVTEQGCGNTWHEAIREALRKTPVIA